MKHCFTVSTFATSKTSPQPLGGGATSSCWGCVLACILLPTHSSPLDVQFLLTEEPGNGIFNGWCVDDKAEIPCGVYCVDGDKLIAYALVAVCAFFIDYLEVRGAEPISTILARLVSERSGGLFSARIRASLDG